MAWTAGRATGGSGGNGGSEGRSRVLGTTLTGTLTGTLVAALALASLGVAAPAGAATRTARVTSGQVTVTGSGFGHGVGLSQYGALGMARAGADVTGILQHFYTGVQVAPSRDAVDVRVNVVHGATTVTLGSTARAAGGGGLQLLPDGGPPLTLAAGDTVTLVPTALADRTGVAATVTRAVPAATPPSASSSASSSAPVDGPVTVVATGVEVRWPGTRLVTGTATTLDVSSRGTSARTKQRSYRWGTLRVAPVGQVLDGVLTLDLHGEYLRGVAEMPASWPAAALQAQVVAARNYALAASRSTGTAACGGCQLWDDTRSQVYAGWAKEAEDAGPGRYAGRWAAAVAATQPTPTTGTTVLYQGRPVSALYASSTGGRTRAAADVWGRAVPYLASVADPWSADPTVNPGYARWSRTVPVSRLLAVLSLPDLATIKVTERDSGGAARVVTATSADGTRRTIGCDRLTSRLGLPGAWIAAIALPASAATTTR